MENRGQDVLLQVGTAVIHATLTKGIDFSTEMIETTHDQSTDEFKTYLPGDKDASISFDGNVEEGETTNYAIEDLIDAHIAGSQTPLTFIYGKTGAGSMTISGSGFLSALNLGASRNAAQTFSGSIQVTGAVTRGTVSA